MRRHANELKSQKHGGDGNILGFLNVKGLQHYIRLRKFVPITDQLSAELGVDLNVKRQNYFPHAALTYQVCCCLLPSGAIPLDVMSRIPSASAVHSIWMFAPLFCTRLAS